MGEQTAIQWTDHTWNWAVGCRKVSAGCKFCYLYRDAPRFGRDPSEIRRAAPSTFNAPLRRDRAGAWKWPDGGRVFTCSWSDFFLEELDEWRPAAWDTIRQRQGLTFQVLTKRADRIADHLPPDWGDGWPNVWLGVSVENQDNAWRALALMGVPARVRFLSVEPLLGHVDLRRVISSETGLGWDVLRGLGDNGARCPPIHWVIVGGESGAATTSRDCNAEWIRQVVRDCQAAGVAVFVKQLGSRFFDEGVVVGARMPWSYVNEHRLRDSHGGDPSEWPAGLDVREFPS